MGEAAAGSRCPSCQAAVRPDAQWCTLCYLDLRPKTPAGTPTDGEVDPLTAPLLDVVLPPMTAATVSSAPAPDPLGTPVADPLADPFADPLADPLAGGRGPRGATWPCTQCGAANTLNAAACQTCGSSFLAAAQERESLVLPLVGDLHQMSRGRRLGLAALVVLALLIPLALVTVLTTGAPPAGTSSDPGTATGTVQTGP